MTRRVYYVRTGRADADPCYLDTPMWPSNGYKPFTTAYAYLAGESLRVEFRTFEECVVSTWAKPNDPVWRDSCVEFFVNFFPKESDRYMNFETNPAGAMLIGFGASREDRVLLDDDRAAFGIRARGEPGFWSVEYGIPFDFVARHYGMPFRPVKGTRMAANFYKCGDDTPFPHHYVWNPIRSELPDFHRPESFGRLVVSMGRRGGARGK
jgi:hypothetical protein